jgi:meckelin
MMMMSRLTTCDIFLIVADGRRLKAKDSGSKGSLVKTYKAMNTFLRSFFESSEKDFTFSIKPKTMSESILGATPDTSKGCVLLEDNGGIEKTLLRGVEYELLVAYICLFIYIDIISDSSIFAALFVWILDLVIIFIRMHFGEKNIASKSLLDSKFLL